MPTQTSSAKPVRLIEYSRTVLNVDADLLSLSVRLKPILEHFEASCREEMVSVSYLADRLRSHTSDAAQKDVWVGTVGTGFLLADTSAALQGWVYQSMLDYLDRHQGAVEAGDNYLRVLFASNTLLLDILSKFPKNRGVFKDHFTELGRFLNQIEGSPKAGWVGKMQDIYRKHFAQGAPKGSDIDNLLKSGKLQSFLFVADVAFGTIDDLKKGTYGDNFGKAVGVNTIDSGINLAISLNPYGAAALLINSAVQIGGNLQIGIDRTIADYIASDNETRQILLETSDLQEAALEQMDLGNITKQLGEGVYEGYEDYFATGWNASDDIGRAMESIWREPSLTNLKSVFGELAQSKDVQKYTVQQLGMCTFGPLAPLFTTESGRKNLLDTGKAVVNVVDGIADWSITNIAKKQNQSLALSAKLVNELPVSNQWKEAVSATTKEYMRFNTGIAEKFAGTFQLEI